MLSIFLKEFITIGVILKDLNEPFNTKGQPLLTMLSDTLTAGDHINEELKKNIM